MTKTCRVCGKEKPLYDFPKHRFMADGYLTKCKACSNESHRAYRAVKKEYRGYSPSKNCEDCRTCENDGCRHNRRTA